MHEVLHAFGPRAGAEPYARIEQAQIGFAYTLTDDREFAGRLRVMAEPGVVRNAPPLIRLQLISRRIVGTRDLDAVLEQSHGDVVKGFTAVTTERMHEVWGRFR